jgi:hypothetical protein
VVRAAEGPAPALVAVGARRRLRLSATVCQLLQRISARQIDRRLGPTKRQLQTRRYGRTKPGTLLNGLYRHELRLFQNLFLPSVKRQRKERVGARLRRRYDVPRTPLERVLACPEADPQAGAALVRLRDQLDPFALAEAIDRKVERLVGLATPARPP